MRLRRYQGARPKQRSGATAVEFALVCPIILMLFLGAIELNSLNFVRNSAANAAYEAARTAMVSGGKVSEGRARGLQYLQQLGVHHGATVTGTETTADVSFEVKVPMNLNSYGLSRFTGGYVVTQSIKLKRESVTRVN